MSVGKFYPQFMREKNTVGKIRFRQLFILCCFSLFGMTAIAQNTKPTFVHGDSIAINGCININRSLDSFLAISDADTGQIETWTRYSAPLHGSLGLLDTASYSDTSNGGVLTPSGLYYIPATGYLGNDTFQIVIFDGLDTSIATVYITVNDVPTLSSTLTPFAICDSTTFNYTPTSTTAGATFVWYRPFVSGIMNPPSTGVANPYEHLTNTTAFSIPVSYVYTITATTGCSSIETVVVIVKPTPHLSSSPFDTVCSGGLFTYIPASSAAGTTFSWSRDPIDGLSPPGGTGIGNISEALVNSTDTAITAVYLLGLTDSGCTSLYNVYVRVNPKPNVTSITSEPASSELCSGTQYQNFGAGIAPPPGVTYTWSAVNAYIFASGIDHQYAIVNFPTTGTAYVILTITVAENNCVINDTVTINVNSDNFTPAGIIYYHELFVYEDNSINSYQWGYDDATTLDSTAVPGAEFQSWVNTSPDFLNRYYWVIVTKNGCSQKIYYNPPQSVIAVQSKAVQLKTTPNPAANTVKVSVNGVNGGDVEIIVTDVLGQKVLSQDVKGQSAQFDVTKLPAGCYFVNCYEQGQKMAITRFIKN